MRSQQDPQVTRQHFRQLNSRLISFVWTRRSGKKHNIRRLRCISNAVYTRLTSLHSIISAQRVQPDQRRHFLLNSGSAPILLSVACLCRSWPRQSIAGDCRAPSQQLHVGKLIFVQSVTPELATTKKFYAGLFGWEFRDIQIGEKNYAAAFLDGRLVAGLVHKNVPAGEHRQPAWLGFFAVGDVDAAKKIALQNGAKALFEPHDIPGRGRVAVFADPQGAVFAVLASSSGDPPDVLAAPGESIWSLLLTSDPDTDAAFYQALFGYEVFELPSSDGTRHLLFASENYARASANKLPANRPKAHPHWLNYVRVRDAAKMTEKVVALGAACWSSRGSIATAARSQWSLTLWGHPSDCLNGRTLRVKR